MQQSHLEEFGEFAKAINKGDIDNLNEEAVDMLVTSLGTVLLLGEAVIPYIVRVAVKNDKKNHETHVLRDGKISRRV